MCHLVLNRQLFILFLTRLVSMGNKQIRLDDEARNILDRFGGQASAAVKDLHSRYNILNNRVAELENERNRNKLDVDLLAETVADKVEARLRR